MKICPTCHREYQDHESFCREDGTLLVDKVISTTNDVSYCPKCGEIRREGRNFCHKCGYDFINKKATNKTNRANKTKKSSNFTVEKSNIIIGIYSIIFSVFAIGFCFSNWINSSLVDVTTHVYASNGIIDFIKMMIEFNPGRYEFFVGLVGFISLFALLISAFFNLCITIFSLSKKEFSTPLKYSLLTLIGVVFFINYIVAFACETGGFLGFLALIGLIYIFLHNNVFFAKKSENNSDTLYKVFLSILAIASVFILFAANPIGIKIGGDGSLYYYTTLSGIIGYVYQISYTGDISYLVNLFFYLMYITTFIIFVILMYKKEHLKAGITGFAFSLIDILFIIAIKFIGSQNASYYPNLIVSLFFVLALSSLAIVFRANYKDKYLN